MSEKEKFVQTSLSPSDYKAVKMFLLENDITNQRQWMRDLIYNAVGIEGDIKDVETSESDTK